MFNFKPPEAGLPPASQPIQVPVRFVGGSKHGLAQVATFKVADAGMLDLLDIQVKFGEEIYKYNSSDNSFILERKTDASEKKENTT